MNQLNKEIFAALKKKQLYEVIRLVSIGLAGKHDWQGLHVEIANQMILLFPWDLVRNLLPKQIFHFYESGWLRSLSENRPVNLNGEPIPWFTYPAIDFLDDIVRSDMRIFEWGSGNSTLWWSKRVRSVFSVEDHPAWFDAMQSSLPGNARIMFAKNETYVRSISHIGGKFDIIVVDGSHRDLCLQEAKKNLEVNGFIVFDNADRKEHQNSFYRLSSEGWRRIDFWGLTPSYCYKSCTSIIFRNLEAIKCQSKSTPSEHKSSVDLSCSQALEKI